MKVLGEIIIWIIGTVIGIVAIAYPQIILWILGLIGLRIIYVAYKYEKYCQDNRKREHGKTVREIKREDNLSWIHLIFWWIAGLIFYGFITMPKQNANESKLNHDI